MDEGGLDKTHSLLEPQNVLAFELADVKLGWIKEERVIVIGLLSWFLDFGLLFRAFFLLRILTFAFVLE